MAAKRKKEPVRFDAFISYSRKDRAFAEILERALENYKPPKIEKVPQRNLNIFRDEEDLTGPDYYKAIDKNLAESGKLIILCSPNSRNSKFVNDEIRRFAKKYKAENIIPILLAGIPNNAAKRGDEDKMAFPDALMEVMELPLAISYVDKDWRKNNITKGIFRNNWFSLLANIFGVPRDELEERDRMRQKRRRKTIYTIGSLALIVLSCITAWALWNRHQVATLKYYENNINQARIFEEKAGNALEEQSIAGYQKAWLYTLKALSQDVKKPKKQLSLSRGRIESGSISSGSGINQQIWTSPYLPEEITSIASSPDNSHIAMATRDGLLRIWDMNCGEESAKGAGHFKKMTDLAFSTDGHLLASAANDSLVFLWKLDLHSILKPDTLTFPGESISSVALNPMKPQLAAVSNTGDVFLQPLSRRRGFMRKTYLLSNQTIKEKFYALGEAGNSLQINHIAFSSDGKYLACGSSDSKIHLISLRTRKEIAPLSGHSAAIAKLEFIPKTETLVSFSFDNTIRIRDVVTRNASAIIQGGDEKITGMDLGEDGKILACGYEQGKIVLWKLGGDNKWIEWKKIVGTRSAVGQVVFTKNDSLIFSAHHDDRLRLWDVATGKMLAVSQGHRDAVNTVAFSPDSNIFASGSDDGYVILWDARSGKELGRLSGHRGKVLSLAFNTNGTYLASGGKDSTICLWNIKTMQLDGKLHDDLVHVWSVAFSPVDSLLAAASISNNDNAIRLYNWRTKKQLAKLAAHTQGINSVEFSHNGKLLASAGRDSTICLWKMETLKEIARWRAHDDQIYSVTFSPNDSLLASSAKDETIRLWDVEKMRTLLADDFKKWKVVLKANGMDRKRLAVSGASGDSVEVTKFAHSIDVTDWRHANTWQVPRNEKKFGKMIIKPNSPKRDVWNVAINLKNELLAYELKSGKIEFRHAPRLLKVLRGHLDDVWDVAFRGDGKVLASASGDHSIRLWSVDTGVELAELQGHLKDVFSVAFSHDGKYLASGAFDKTVRLWDVEKSFDDRFITSAKDTIRSVAFSPDNIYFAYAGHDRRLHIKKFGEQKEERIPPKYWDWSILMSVAFSPDNKHLAYGSADDKIRFVRDFRALFEGSNRPQRIELLGHKGDGLSVSFSPDGRQLISGSSDGKIRQWDVKEGKKVERLGTVFPIQHGDKVRCVRFNTDGRYLATASSDKNIFLWERKNDSSWVRTKVLSGHSDGVWGVAFSPNSTILASASWDNTIRLWDVESGEKISTLRGHRGPVLCVEFLSDSILVSGSRDHTIRIWNTFTLNNLDVYNVHSGAVYSLALSADKKLLASGSADKSIRFLEMDKKSTDTDSLNFPTFRKLANAFTEILPFRFAGNNLIDDQFRFYLSPLKDFHFPQSTDLQLLRVPKSPGEETVHWALQKLEENNRASEIETAFRQRETKTHIFAQSGN